MRKTTGEVLLPGRWAVALLLPGRCYCRVGERVRCYCRVGAACRLMQPSIPDQSGCSIGSEPGRLVCCYSPPDPPTWVLCRIGCYCTMASDPSTAFKGQAFVTLLGEDGCMDEMAFYETDYTPGCYSSAYANNYAVGDIKEVRPGCSS